MFKLGINCIFNEMPLYTKEKFEVFKLVGNVYELNEEEFVKFLFYIGAKQNKLITYCHKCKKEFPFNYDKEIFQLNDYKKVKNELVITDSSSKMNIAYISLLDGQILGAQPPYNMENLENDKIWYIHYFFNCTNYNKHNYMLMISIELKDGSFIVRKIGQNPSMLTVRGFDFDKYKDILEKLDAYDNYKKADMSNAEKFHVGAFAYLRRIFEKILNYYSIGIELTDNHVDTKIEAVKDKFDPRINKLLKNLYGILSISIHEIDENKSKEYYSYLKAIIDMQLEFMKTEEDKEKQAKENETIINRIVNLVKKDK